MKAGPKANDCAASALEMTKFLIPLNFTPNCSHLEINNEAPRLLFETEIYSQNNAQKAQAEAPVGGLPLLLSARRTPAKGETCNHKQ